METVPARVVVKRGPNPEQEYTLTPSEITLGRSSINFLAVADPEVSRRHACIRHEDNRYYIEDIGSTNGTFVNGRRITGKIALKNGDEFRLGETITFQFIDVGEQEHPVTSPPIIDSTALATVLELPPDLMGQIPEPTSSPSASSQDALPDQFILTDQTQSGSNCRNLVLGCGCAFLIITFVCAATIFFLDAYQQGRLLYCGPLRPFFEILLGPIGFAPICT